MRTQLSSQTWRDYHRMVEIMRLRDAARRQTNCAQWNRLTYRAEQLLTDRQFPRSKH